MGWIKMAYREFSRQKLYLESHMLPPRGVVWLEMRNIEELTHSLTNLKSLVITLQMVKTFKPFVTLQTKDFSSKFKTTHNMFCINSFQTKNIQPMIWEDEDMTLICQWRTTESLSIEHCINLSRLLNLCFIFIFCYLWPYSLTVLIIKYSYPTHSHPSGWLLLTFLELSCILVYFLSFCCFVNLCGLSEISNKRIIYITKLSVHHWFSTTCQLNYYFFLRFQQPAN